MSHKSRHYIGSCTFQFQSWNPFQSKSLDSDPPQTPKPYSSSSNGAQSKRPCLSDRATSFSVDAIDMSKLSLIEDDKSNTAAPYNRSGLSLIARKRRRRGSRSVSGRSSDRSRNRRCCSVGASAAYGTCSDFPLAIGTDSSGELFGNGDANWASDQSEAKNSRREKDGGSGEKENLGGGFGQFGGGFDAQGNESGYGSEPGYRGDAEFGYEDELDEEEEDARLLFWGLQLGDADSKKEMVGENTFADQKAHHRFRRKKHDYRMVVDSR
ncbi:hypothetical protein HS088_TW08G00733 [Tripterygium wilfordii]|uniref:Uncharacterized protein n=1 Tax=Tripterygium wilfordii TaxID=458696 RepID=A0A7J7DCR3_TRIWF|nr:uncharacterized protein LOC120003409 isoform X2 [Tripterygium wilfordii]KAF5744137.1 hypothetical protein HS088_TW08G00733 [Tripterygium wilfordii]